jgi:16S rRNA (guanine527-N7)-methyltransferase
MQRRINLADRELAVGQMAVSRETLERLDAYVDLLAKWSKITDLISDAAWPTLWTRHIADSGQLLALAPSAKTWLDLGSGAGFPGLILAILIAEQPDANVTLVESDKRKAAFLSEAGRALSLAVSVHGERTEKVIRENAAAPDIVTARALAPLSRLLQMTGPLISKCAVGLFLKGKSLQDELTPEMASDRFSFETIPSRTSPDGHILRVRRKT